MVFPGFVGWVASSAVPPPIFKLRPGGSTYAVFQLVPGVFLSNYARMFGTFSPVAFWQRMSPQWIAVRQFAGRLDRCSL